MPNARLGGLLVCLGGAALGPSAHTVLLPVGCWVQRTVDSCTPSLALRCCFVFECRASCSLLGAHFCRAGLWLRPAPGIFLCTAWLARQVPRVGLVPTQTPLVALAAAMAGQSAHSLVSRDTSACPVLMNAQGIPCGASVCCFLLSLI